jgi:hypothetical protein
MRPFQGLFLIVVFAFLSGCSILHHMDQLLMMGDFSRDKNVQGKVVGEIDAHYDSLVSVIHSGKIKNYPDQASILHNFGEPIARKTVTVDGASQEQWLYRHAIPLSAKDKVYLYFDHEGKLINYTQEKIEWS